MLDNYSPPMSIFSNTESPKNIRHDTPRKYAKQTNELRSIEEIPPIYRHIFQYSYFNKMQSLVLDDALYTDKSVVVSAPTGSGKTVIFELAIVNLLIQLENSNYDGDFKIIYMAPLKALCTEKLTDWYGKFNKLGLTCIEVTGDSDTLNFSQLRAHKIILTTPEKWDALTRRWKDNRQMVEMVKLFIMDEIHLLNEEVRGPVLEAVVSRMKTIQDTLHFSKHSNVPNNIRFIAASATIPNAEDIAEWLSTVHKPCVCYKLDEEYRPVKLLKVVEGFPCNQNSFKFDLFLSYKLKSILEKYCDGKPTLIFCNTRKSVIMTAEVLAKELIFQFSDRQNTKFIEMASKLSEKKLQSLVISGIGCHHAGFLHSDRNIIEQMFREGDLPVLITTSTLAMGVNLPAHLVIIKTTQHYVKGAYTEYEESSILQMMGRAGRPQFDTEGIAVIMTRNQDKLRYERLCGGQQSVESKLHKHFAEHLNAEVALGTIADLLLAMDWLRSTFLYVRATRNPKEYGCIGLNDQKSVEKRLQEICVKWMNSLAQVGLLKMDSDTRVTSTEAGTLMATYCLDLDTMKLILKIKGKESLSELLNLISECHEFADIALRTNEKRILNQLNKNPQTASCRFPLPGKIQSKHMKANCLIQAVFGCLPILDPSLNQESLKIIRLGENIAKCIVSYITRPMFIQKNNKIFKAVLNSTILSKCFAAKMWDNSEYVCRQFNGIGPAFASALVSAGKKSLEAIRQSNPRDLERIINRGPPAGNALKKQALLLPIYELNLESKSCGTINVHVQIANCKDLMCNETPTTGSKHKLSLIVGDADNNLLYFDTIMDINLLSLPNAKVTRTFFVKNMISNTIYAHLISHTWVGIDVQTELRVKKKSFDMDLSNINMDNFPIEINRANSMRLQNKNMFSFMETVKRSQENENIIPESPQPNIKTQNKTQLNKKTATKRNKKQVEYLTPKRAKLSNIYSENLNANEKIDFPQNPYDFNNVSNNKENEIITTQKNLDWVDYELWKNMIKKNIVSPSTSTPEINQASNTIANIVNEKLYNTSIESDNTAQKITSFHENDKKYQKDNTSKYNDEIIAENMLEIFEDICNENTAGKSNDFNRDQVILDYQLENNFENNITSSDIENIPTNGQNDLTILKPVNVVNKSSDVYYNSQNIDKGVPIYYQCNNKAHPERENKITEIIDNPILKNDFYSNIDNYDRIVDETTYIHNSSPINLISEPVHEKEPNYNIVDVIDLENNSKSSIENSNINKQNNDPISQTVTNEEISIVDNENYQDGGNDPAVMDNCNIVKEKDEIVNYLKNDAIITTENIENMNDLISFTKLIIDNSNFFKDLISRFTKNSIDKPIQKNLKNNKKNKIVSWGDPLVLSLLANDSQKECDTNCLENEKLPLQTEIELPPETSPKIGENETENNSNEVLIENEKENVVNNIENDDVTIEENAINQNAANLNTYNDKECSDKFAEEIQLPDLENFKKAYKHEKCEKIIEKYNHIVNWLKTCPFDVKEIDELTCTNDLKENNKREVPLEISSILQKHEKTMNKDIGTNNINENTSPCSPSHTGSTLEQVVRSKKPPEKRTLKEKCKHSINNLFLFDDNSFISLYQDKPFDKNPIEIVKKNKNFENKLNHFQKKVFNNGGQDKYSSYSEQFQGKSFELNDHEDFTPGTSYDIDMDDHIQNPPISVIPNFKKSNNFNSQSDVFMKQFQFNDNDVYVPKFNAHGNTLNQGNISSLKNPFHSSKDKEALGNFFDHNFSNKNGNYNTGKDQRRKPNIDDVLDNLRNFECTPKRKLPHKRF